jgi:predicted restriction endonuclease
MSFSFISFLISYNQTISKPLLKMENKYYMNKLKGRKEKKSQTMHKSFIYHVLHSKKYNTGLFIIIAKESLISSDEALNKYETFNLINFKVFIHFSFGIY